MWATDEAIKAVRIYFEPIGWIREWVRRVLERALAGAPPQSSPLHSLSAQELKLVLAFRMASEFRERGNTERATELLKQALVGSERSDLRRYVLVSLSELQIELGADEQAEMYARMVLDEFEKRHVGFHRYLRILWAPAELAGPKAAGPEVLRAYALLASIYLHRGDLIEAEAMLRHSVDLPLVDLSGLSEAASDVYWPRRP